MISPHNSKSSSRAYLRELLEKTRPFENTEIQKRIRNNLAVFLNSKAGIWAGYQPLSQEPDWIELCSSLKNVDWAFPVVIDQAMTFYKGAQAFARGSLGFREPQGGEPVSLTEIQGALIPGLGFSRSGHRLGRGKGFYDRALSQYLGEKVGICFSVQFIEAELPFEDHDVKVDRVVTEDGIFDVH